MNRFRRLTIAAGLSLALVSVPAMALAADATYAISGVEYAATEDVGSFAGVAFTVARDDYGIWQATIVHVSLGYESTAITGTFNLYGKVRKLTGEITGSIVQTAGSTGTVVTRAGCNKQTYSVNGNLTGTGFTGATFVGVVLTHYRIWLWGSCRTYAATVKGAVSFIGLQA